MIGIYLDIFSKRIVDLLGRLELQQSLQHVVVKHNLVLEKLVAAECQPSCFAFGYVFEHHLDFSLVLFRRFAVDSYSDHLAEVTVSLPCRAYVLKEGEKIRFEPVKRLFIYIP